MSEGKSWYETGYDGAKKEQDRIDQMRGPRHFWMPPDSERDVVFIDDDPFCIHEHNPQMNGSWQNFMTCLSGIVENPPCCKILGVNTRYYVGYLTVVDCSEYVDKKGNKHQFEVKLYGAKLQTIAKLRRKKEMKGSLAGTMWKVARTGKRSPNCGDDFDFMKQVDNPQKLFEMAMLKGKKLSEFYAKAAENAESLNRLKKLFQIGLDASGKPVPKVVPFNYIEVCKPMDATAMRDLLQGSKIESGSGGSDSSPDGGAADEDVPF